MANMRVNTDPRMSPPIKVSYPTIFQPKAFQPGGDPTFSIVLMIDKKNKEQMGFLRVLHADVKTCLETRWPDPAKRPRTPIIGETRSPIKDGDKTLNSQGIPYGENNPEYAGHYFVRAATKQRPGVVDLNKQEIVDSNEIYGGCICRVNLNAYAFDMSQNKGVTFGLNAVQKWADDERFGGGRPPIDELFDDVGANGADDPANYPGGVDPFADVRGSGQGGTLADAAASALDDDVF